jgi:hypothetical protein
MTYDEQVEALARELWRVCYPEPPGGLMWERRHFHRLARHVLAREDRARSLAALRRWREVDEAVAAGWRLRMARRKIRARGVDK